MNVLLLLVNIALALIAALFVLSFFKLRGKVAYLLALYLLVYADVVLILQVVGLFGILNAAAVLLLQVLFTASGFWLWHRDGRPALFAALAHINLAYVTEYLRALTKSPLLLVLVLAAGYAYSRHAQMILLLPPDNYDSLTYHLSRVGYWLQYQSFHPWPTPNLRQTTLPMNAELGLLWTILWWGTDRLTGFVQWITVPVIMLGIYALVRLLGYSRSQGVFTALLWSTLTQVLFQSTTTQNDLVTASFWVAMVYLFFAGLKERLPALFYLSALALGLAIGTKSTSLLVLPALLVALLAVLRIHWKDKLVQALVWKWGLASLVAVTCLASYSYIQNIIVFGHPLGPQGFYARHISTRGVDGLMQRLHLLRDNTGRYIYQMVDFSPLPWQIPTRINPIKKALFSPIFALAGVSLENPETVLRSSINLDYINPVGEGGSWFGPVLAFLLPVILFQGNQGIRKSDPLRLTLAILPLGFLLVHSATQAWTPDRGRFYMVPVSVSMPLLAALLSSGTPWHRGLRAFIMVLGLMVMLNVLANNPALRTLSWAELSSDGRRDPSWADTFSYRMLIENVPVDASIGVVSHAALEDYPFFGEYLARRVTLAVPEQESELPRGELGQFQSEFEESDFLFFSARGSPPQIDLATREFFPLSYYGSELLCIRRDLRSPDACDQEKWPFTRFYEGSSGAVCPQFPIVLGVALSTPNGDFAPVLEAGRGLVFNLWVMHGATLNFSVDVDPAGITRRQTLQLVISGSGTQRQQYSAFFKGLETVKFVIPLQADRYTVALVLGDHSNEAKLLKIRVSTP